MVMDRRAFFAVSAASLLLLSLPAAAEIPTIRYCSIPAIDTSKVDCFQSVGYFGGTITIRGKEYGALFSAPESEYRKHGREAIEYTQRARVDMMLREVWERLR